MGKKSKQAPREGYLELPYHILNLPRIRLADKILLAHFYSFGEKGCWQSNATLARMFMTSPSTVRRSIASLKRQGPIVIGSPKGYHRAIWAG